MTVVLDSNVLFAALVSQGLCREVFLTTARFHTLVSSKVLVSELDEVIDRKLGHTPATKQFIRNFRKESQLVKPEAIDPPVCRDADDDVVLGTALAAKADCIATGNKDLLILKKFRKIQSLSPREFIEAMESGNLDR